MFLTNILIFLFVLGLLIFFHEMGHFLAAKAFGIYVERFSLGMPPRLWGFQYGETDYCVGALPIGGYVKMAGQEDTPRSEEEQEKDFGHIPKERWFSSKPVWQRSIVLVAGPLMNLVLAVGLYAIVVGVGSEVAESKVDSRIGQIEAGAPALEAPLYQIDGPDAIPAEVPSDPDALGWRTGDRILTLNGERVDNIGDVAFGAIASAGAPVRFVIERPEVDGSSTYYYSVVRPRLMDDDSEYPRFGVAPFMTALVSRVFPDSPADEAGVEPGDIVRAINGDIVDTQTAGRIVENTPAGETLTLTIERDGETFDLELEPRLRGRLDGMTIVPNLLLNPSADPETVPEIAHIMPDAANRTGLMRKDIIKSIDGEPATAELIHEIQETRIGEEVTLEILRPAMFLGLGRPEERKTVTVEVEPLGNLGVIWGGKTVFHRVPPAEVAPEAFRLTYQALARTGRVLAMLVSRDVSMTELGGPVMIYQVTTEAAEMGWSWLLEITAFISINLCIFNLLPLPVLDGGQLTFAAIEAIRRKPVSQVVWERTQLVGVLLIISLIVFVTYNDIARWVDNTMP